MLELVLDSATKKLYIALVLDKKVVFEKYYTEKNAHATHIVDGINLGLISINRKVKDIDHIVCGVGPGSYTGVRMAVTVAKMLSSLGNISLSKISTLRLMASSEKTKCLAYIDARRGNAFAGIFDDNKVILEDSFIELDKIEKNSYEKIISEDNFVVNPLKVIELATKVDEPDLLVPNYLRDTEAERNLC